MRRIASLLGLVFAASSASAQGLVESPAPDSVSVTVYRATEANAERRRRYGQWPDGYALITEVRTIRLPAGESVIRFVGVSEGMMPETAIVTGLPRGVGEKNRDARLLSPAALIDAYLKRRVTIRRTDRATGKVREGEAVIQSGPGGGVVLTTDEGVEALGCSGLPQAPVYPGIPADLSAKPTLSVTTNSAAATTVTVQLSYLAQGFDWSAHYVARVAEDGESFSLFAWLTLVNAGGQGFDQAHTSAVAGAPNKEAAARLPQGLLPELHLQCWPMDTTSTPGEPPAPPAPPAPVLPIVLARAEDIVVTGSRMGMMAPAPVMVAQQEDLGDLKLYRIPEPVTVAARSTKQVAMIDRPRVTFARIYKGAFEPTELDDEPESVEAARVLRTENREGQGLGLPLPAGGVAIFEEGRGESLLVGESALTDRAIGEEVELETGTSTDVRYTVTALPRSTRRHPYAVEVTNARSTPEVFELPIPYVLAKTSAKLVERKGIKTWRATVPANGSARLTFVLKVDR
ncbi:DUF4139 domain-containing protein [Sphingomonas sp. CJ20]